MKRFYLFLFCLCVACVSVATPDYMFKRIGMKDGLPNNQINSIYKDSEGFVWFATASGLARYDGYGFKVFRNDAKVKNSLPDNFVKNLVEDADGRLWMCTGEQQYTFFDRVTETFESDVCTYLSGIGIDDVPQNVYVDKTGSSWFYLADRGCFRYCAGEANARQVSLPEELLDGRSLTDIAECGEGLLLVYDNGLLICIDWNALNVKWVVDDVAMAMGDECTEVFSLFVDADDDIWIYGISGMWLYSPASRQWKSLSDMGLMELTHNMVRTIEQDRDGYIWIGKDRDGIDVWDKRTNHVISLTSSAEDEHSLSNNTILTLYKDNAGVMWVGTYKKGVACYDESLYKFTLIPLGDVTCVEEGDEGTLWIGTNDGGLQHWNPVTGVKRTFLHQGENSLTSNVVVSLLRASDGKLWIGTFWGGLDCYDGHRFTHYRHSSGDSHSLANNNVWSLAEDREGNIWIGTLGGGIQCLNPRTGVFTNYNTVTCGLTSDYIASICMGRDRRLIVGTASSGIAILDLKTGKVIRQIGAQTGDVRLSSQSINQVYEDSRGLIWIATRDGLDLYNPRNNRLQAVHFPAESVGSFIAGIAEDSRSTLWATTNNGVVNIALSEGEQPGEYAFRFHTYDSKDGLQGCEFNQRAIRRLLTGEMVVGGLYGVNMFTPGKIKYNLMLPKVLFTDFLLFNEKVKIGREYDGRIVLDKAVNAMDKIQLDYRQNVFTVQFASDNFILPDKTSYVYKLEGFDNDWLTSTAEMHCATYTNLAPGSYTLKVKATNSDGFEGVEEAALRIEILPPFWMTIWAYLLYVLLLVGIVCLAVCLIQRRERNKFRMRQLEEDVRKREELNQMKFRFYTNISHELRTPLTLIISPLEDMMKNAVDEKLHTRLTVMYRNAQRLLNLVNQLLDFRKNEMTGMQLSLSEGDIVGFVRGICSSFLSLSEKKGVHLTFFTSIDSLDMLFDEDKMGKVVMNLLSNAFKFTPEGGRVDVALEAPQELLGRLRIKVSDTGIGIRDADKGRIFDCFYQVEQTTHRSTGSGIGLSLVRDFVLLHEGTVRVVDNVGSGSVFIVEIPIRYASGGKPVAEEGETADAETEKAVAGMERKPLALIVDDNKELIAFMKDSLSLDFRIQAATNGKEAWQMILQVNPDIIVSDVMMPEMDGNELARLVKNDKRTCDIPVVLLTARQALEDKVEGLTIGADDYVTKPFNVEILILRMRKLIELSRKNKVRTRINPEPSAIAITSLDEQLVANAIRYVEDNISRSDLSVEELSRELGMSRVHLYKRLSQITGKTPIEFIRVIRLKRAAQLLRESQMNVSEIAFQLGFNNPKYFSKYFKDEFGVLPSVYQEREGK